MDGENVLHIAVQSACDDSKIAEVVQQLLSRRFVLQYKAVCKNKAAELGCFAALGG